MPERKVIFKVDVRVGDTDTVFKKCQVYSICDDTLKNYTVDYDSDSSYKIPKDQRNIIYYAFALDEQEKSLRDRILREDNVALDAPTPLTQADSGGIMKPEENIGEVKVVEEKVLCPHCTTEFEKALLEKKNSLDKCPICHKWFLDSVTCSSCKTTFKRDFIENLENKEICPMCEKRWDEKTESDLKNEILAQADNVMEVYNIRPPEPSNPKDMGMIHIRCTKCGDTTPRSYNRFDQVTDRYVILSEEALFSCDGCGHKTSNVILVNIENPIENPYTHVPKCPQCHSILIEKISASSKLVKAAAFGLFAIPEVGKQWKCKVCGHKW